MTTVNAIFSDDIDIDTIGLSARLYNALSRWGVKTVGDVKKITDKEIFHIRNIGAKSLDELNRLIPGRDRGKSRITPVDVIAMWKSGLSIRQIYWKAGVSEDITENILKQGGFDLSAPNENRQSTLLNADAGDTLVCNMDLSVYIFKYLYRNGIYTERDIRAKSDRHILQLRWLDGKDLAEIHALLPDRFRTMKGHGKDDKERLADLKNMRESGSSITDISEKYKITTERVSLILKTAGMN